MTIDYNLNEAILRDNEFIFDEIYQRVKKQGSLTDIVKEYRDFAESISIGTLGLAYYVIEHAKRVMEHSRREQS